MRLKILFQVVATYVILACLAGCIAKAITAESEETTQDSLSKKEVKKMIVHTVFDGTIPASPGSNFSIIDMIGPSTFVPASSELREYPFEIPAGANLYIKKARLKSIGAIGLRQGFSPTTGIQNKYAFAKLPLGTSPDHAPVTFYMDIEIDDWTDVNFLIPAIQERSALYVGDTYTTGTTLRADHLQLVADTRNLQTIYYGSPFQILVELDIEVAQ